MATIGFVILEYNQAGGPPVIPSFADIHDTREEAETDKDWHEGNTRDAGRRDRYVIATLEVSEDDRD